MAKDIIISENKLTHSNPACQAAEHCCWYETRPEDSSV
jgi:hypothetical protein